MPITEQERQGRMRTVQGAYAINAIAGGPVSDYAEQLFARWAEGEITLEEVKATLIKHHQRIAEELQRKKNTAELTNMEK